MLSESLNTSAILNLGSPGKAIPFFFGEIRPAAQSGKNRQRKPYFERLSKRGLAGFVSGYIRDFIRRHFTAKKEYGY
jgi:hypothetical protein